MEPGWTFLDSLYYATVSLFTIGFGDLVSASNPGVEAKLGPWIWVYQSFTMMWLLCGLSYTVMITEMSRRAIRKAYKKLHQGEKQDFSTKNLREKPQEAGAWTIQAGSAVL